MYMVYVTWHRVDGVTGAPAIYVQFVVGVDVGVVATSHQLLLHRLGFDGSALRRRARHFDEHLLWECNA